MEKEGDRYLRGKWTLESCLVYAQVLKKKGVKIFMCMMNCRLNKKEISHVTSPIKI